jgi:hypothetical protein
VIFTVSLPMVSVATRWLDDGFAWTDTENVLLPVPLAAFGVAQVLSDDAVQAQPVWVVMKTESDCWFPVIAGEDGVTVKVQPSGAAWVIVTVCPAIVTVPVRADCPVFAAMASTITAPPEPLAADGVIQDAELDAFQSHPVPVVSVTFCVPAALVVDAAVGDTEKVHGAAAWVTVTVCPAIVTVPVRGDWTVFAGIVSVSAPLPEPPAPDSAIQDDELDADQVHPVRVVTVTSCVPAMYPRNGAAGDTEKVHGAPACVMVTLRPATTTVPVREVRFGFSSMSSVSAPLPDALGIETVIHGTAADADQTQPGAVVTATTCEPSVSATLADVGDTV